MTTYKVHIATDGDKTSYTVNGLLLAETAKIGTICTMTTNGETRKCATLSEAEDAAKAAVTKILELVGCVPNFINE